MQVGYETSQTYLKGFEAQYAMQKCMGNYSSLEMHISKMLVKTFFWNPKRRVAVGIHGIETPVTLFWPAVVSCGCSASPG